jgi:16S rRNA (uracil1498-N3)-methyltransferase
MKRHIFLSPDSMRGERVTIEGENYHYLKNVLRVRRGEKLDAVIGDGRYQLLVSSVGGGAILCEVIGKRDVQSRSMVRINVYLGLLKSKKMDYAVAKLSEMGVEGLFPLKTGRTVPAGEPGPKKSNRWEKIAQEGSKVSGAEKVMKVFPLRPLDDVINGLSEEEGEFRLVFSTEEPNEPYRKVLDSIKLQDEMVFHLFFGPEGGFTAEELHALSFLGVKAVTMGKYVLKSETAAIIGTGFLRVYYAGL